MAPHPERKYMSAVCNRKALKFNYRFTQLEESPVEIKGGENVNAIASALGPHYGLC